MAFVLFANDGATEEGNFLWMVRSSLPGSVWGGARWVGQSTGCSSPSFLLRCGTMQLARLPHYVDHVMKERGSDSCTISRGGSRACFCRFLQHVVMTTGIHGNVLPESSHLESVIKETTQGNYRSLLFGLKPLLILSQLSAFEVFVSRGPLIEVT